MACSGCNNQPIDIVLSAILEAAKKQANQDGKTYIITTRLTIEEYNPEREQSYKEIIMPDTNP